MTDTTRNARHWPGIRRLRAAVAAGCLVAAGATLTAPAGTGHAVQPPPPYPCTYRLQLGTGGVVCHQGRARAVLIYDFPTWYGVQVTSAVGPCVNPGNVSVAVIPSARWWAGARPLSLSAQSC